VLTAADGLAHLVVASRPAPSRFAVFSDGLLRLAINLATGEPHAPFFRPLFAFAAAGDASGVVAREAELAAFLHSDRVCARSDDDKTILLAARIAVPEPPAGGGHAPCAR
jgi:hypothetical protein